MFFLIVGAGTEFKRIQLWFSENRPKNAKLLSGLEKKEYDVLLSACDVGMIFLNPNFTIPNYPSRLLSYLENGQPVLVAADPNTDIGYDLELNECGMSVVSGNIKPMKEAISYLCNMNEIEFNVLKNNARMYLEKEFAVKNSYSKIMNKVSG